MIKWIVELSEPSRFRGQDLSNNGISLLMLKNREDCKIFLLWADLLLFDLSREFS